MPFYDALNCRQYVAAKIQPLNFSHFATSLDQYQFCLNEKTIRVRVTLLKERVFIFLRPKRNILGITNEKTNWKKFWRFSD